MAALLVGGIALGVDKIKQHRAERKGKDRARTANASASSVESNEKEQQQVEEQLPSYEGATADSSRPQRPGAERRGRRGYTQLHASNPSNLHPLERNHEETDTGLASLPEGRQANSNSFVDDEKQRLRRAYAERARASDDGRRGRPNPVHPDEQQPPRYLERAPGSFRDRRLPQNTAPASDERVSDGMSTPTITEEVPSFPPSYDAVAGQQQT